MTVLHQGHPVKIIRHFQPYRNGMKWCLVEDEWPRHNWHQRWVWGVNPDELVMKK